MKLNLLGLALVFVAFCANAQIRTPQPSPLCKTTQTVGLTDITLTYSRPSMKGREIFGKFIAYDKVWRTGANQSTKIAFTDDVKVEGTAVPKGEYAIMSFPSKDTWTIILTKEMGVNEGNYKSENDLLRFTVKAQKVSPTVETFTMNVTDITMNTANVEIAWENTSVKFKVEVEVDSKVEAQIKSTLNPPANVYYQSASYYFDAKKDMNQAYEWVKKAVDVPQPQYWVVHLKAKIEKELKKYDDAIATAEKSMTLAKEGKNDQYVKFNEDLINECKKAKK